MKLLEQNPAWTIVRSSSSNNSNEKAAITVHRLIIDTDWGPKRLAEISVQTYISAKLSLPVVRTEKHRVFAFWPHIL